MNVIVRELKNNDYNYIFTDREKQKTFKKITLFLRFVQNLY